MYKYRDCRSFCGIIAENEAARNTPGVAICFNMNRNDTTKCEIYDDHENNFLLSKAKNETCQNMTTP